MKMNEHLVIKSFFIFICVFVSNSRTEIYMCVCVFGAERERMRDGERVRESEIFAKTAFFNCDISRQ